MSFTLRKDEKLRHTRLVEDLFTDGNSLYDFPLRVTWRLVDADELIESFRADVPDRLGKIQMLITVPKKKLHHAVDRVLMRRRIREAYRLNRLSLKETAESIPNAGTLSIAFIYIADKILPYSLVETKIKRILSKLENILQQQQPTE